jgi:hypothetical protein
VSLRVTLFSVDVESALPRVPRRNLGSKSPEVFGRVWAAAERRNDAGGAIDYHLVGVVRTLRWLAGKTVQTPVTRETSWVLPESCDHEYMAALAATRSKVLHSSQVAAAGGAVEVLGWMYHGQPEPYSTTSTRSSVASRA